MGGFNELFTERPEGVEWDHNKYYVETIRKYYGKLRGNTIKTMTKFKL